MEVKCVVVRHRLHRLHRRRSCQNRRNRASTSIRPAFTPSSPHYFFHSFLHSLLPSSSSPPSSPHLPFPFFPQSILTSIHYSAKTCMAEGSSTPSIFLIPSFLCPPFPLSLLPLYFIAASLFPNVLLFFLSPHSLPPSFLLHLPPPFRIPSFASSFVLSFLIPARPPSLIPSIRPFFSPSFFPCYSTEVGAGPNPPGVQRTFHSLLSLFAACFLLSFQCSLLPPVRFFLFLFFLAFPSFPRSSIASFLHPSLLPRVPLHPSSLLLSLKAPRMEGRAWRAALAHPWGGIPPQPERTSIIGQSG